MSAPSPTSLETERLVLRPRRPEEADVYRRLWTERDPRTPAHRRIDVDGRPTVDDLAAEIRRELAEPGSVVLAIEVRGTIEVVGYCGLLAHSRGAADDLELVYEVVRRAHGRGYATEASAAVVAWASTAGYARLWATVRRWNTASRRVAAKLGFTETGEVEVDPVHGDSLLLVHTLTGTSNGGSPAYDRLTRTLDPVVTSADSFTSGQAGARVGEDGA